MDAPGVVDESRPDSSLSGRLPVDGCWNQANQYGIVLDLPNLGCVENSIAARIAMDSGLTARGCGDAPHRRWWGVIAEASTAASAEASGLLSSR